MSILLVLGHHNGDLVYVLGPAKFGLKHDLSDQSAAIGTGLLMRRIFLQLLFGIPLLDSAVMAIRRLR
jgi:hypothetical protein